MIKKHFIKLKNILKGGKKMIVVKESVRSNYLCAGLCNNYGGENCPNDACGFDTPS